MRQVYYHLHFTNEEIEIKRGLEANKRQGGSLNQMCLSPDHSLNCSTILLHPKMEHRTIT